MFSSHANIHNNKHFLPNNEIDIDKVGSVLLTHHSTIHPLLLVIRI